MTQQYTLTSIHNSSDGIDYLIEYTDADSFEHLPHNQCSQCYAFAMKANDPEHAFLIVNNITKPGIYSPVGGGIELGERPDEAIIREVKEESNMKVLAYAPIGYQKTTPIGPTGSYLSEEILADINKRTDTRPPFYQLRYVCIVEPYGPFESDPAGKVTEILFVPPTEYKKYFDWGEVSDRLVERAVLKYSDLTNSNI